MTQPTSLGYCVFEVADLVAWKAFAKDVVGFQLGEEDVGQDCLRLRLDDHESRILLVAGVADDISAAGWEFPTELALDAYVAELTSRGVEVQAGSAEQARRRRVKKFYHCTDPAGWDHEFHYGPFLAPADRPFCSRLISGGFAAGRLGVGHIVAVTEDASRQNAFYRDKLGFSVSDYIRSRTDLAGGAELEVSFYHVAAGRHHSIAVAELAGHPKRLGHLMVEANDLADLGMAFDRFAAAGVPIFSTIGQHPNDRMVSFYAATPSGFAIEVGWGGVVIDDASWDVKQYAQASLWGHRAPSAR